MNKKYFLLAFIFLVFIIFYFAGIVFIGNQSPILKPIKSIFPQEIKLFLKKTIFYPKYQKLLKEKAKEDEVEYFYDILIKTNNINAFELKSNDKIYIYRKIPIKELIINTYSENKEICLKEESLNNNFVIDIYNIIERCKNSYFYQGVIDKRIYFYFALKRDKSFKKASNNLLILPISNFFNYSSNIFKINKYSVGDDANYLTHANEIPTNKKIMWSENTHKSILNLKKIFKNFDIIYDYEIEYFDLNQYENIIFPLHQEYISYNSLDKIYSFLNINDNKNIISIGSDNFRRLVRNIYKDNKFTSIIFLPELVNYSKYNLNTADTGLFNNCVLTNSDFQLGSLGVIMNPFLNKNSKQFFYDIKCDGNKKLPLLTVTKFGKNNLIQFNADQAGINFTNSNKLKTKLLDIVND